jgi:hypothetical protein
MQLVTVQECLTFSAASPLSFISGYSDRTATGNTHEPHDDATPGQQGQNRDRTSAAPASLQTTLCDVMAALQSDGRAGYGRFSGRDHAWLRTGRITFARDATVAA